jgi:RimJ/RimL family protein N-acetyltransferase
VELTGKQIKLREFLASDVDALLAIHSNPRLLRYYSPELGTPEFTKTLVDNFIGWAGESPRQNFQLAIVDLKTNRLLGSCGIRRKDCPPGQAEFGIGIDADYWGKGIGREAAQLLLRFAFAELDLREVYGIAVSENEAVAKFVRRLGFAPGMHRQGGAWMQEKGWSAMDWRLTREAWQWLAR